MECWSEGKGNLLVSGAKRGQCLFVNVAFDGATGPVASMKKDTGDLADLPYVASNEKDTGPLGGV